LTPIKHVWNRDLQVAPRLELKAMAHIAVFQSHHDCPDRIGALMSLLVRANEFRFAQQIVLALRYSEYRGVPHLLMLVLFGRVL
jgi:hypothetical protein